MSKSKIDEIIITSDNVDLTNCAREQIHIPNSIQPYGALLIVDKNSFEIIQASYNVNEILKYQYNDLIGSPLKKILNTSHINKIRNCLDKDFSSINPIRIKINKTSLNLIVHKIENHIFLEFEPIDQKYKNDFISFYNLTKKVVDQMEFTTNLNELSEVIVNNIQNLTGFDRVMVYRFYDDNSGHVIAERKKDGLDSFNGLRYPATDVPEPARRLYLLNYIRLIADVDYQPVPLPKHTLTNESFDLSFSNLRSVSPIHIEYLKNMGVKASMSISLIKKNSLWGLIACHHNQPKYLPYEVRLACEFLAKVMSLNLIAKEESNDLSYKMEMKEKLSVLFEKLSQAANIGDSLNENIDLLKSLINSEGVALCLNDQVSLFGNTLEVSQIKELNTWLRKYQKKTLFSTDRLPKIYPDAVAWESKLSGILVLYLSQIENSYIIWFRSEVSETVTWAGNPNKEVKLEKDGTLTLSPRKSFDLWKQTVTDQSLPWLQSEIQQITDFRNFLVDIMFKKSNELLELNFALQKSNEELDSFAYIASHDLKEPLRGIYNYSYLLLEDYEQVLEEDGSRKLRTLMTLSKRMENLIDALLRYSRLGRQELDLTSVDIEELISKDVTNILVVSQQDNIDIRMPQKLPVVKADKTLVEEVFMNLITNGLKYNNKDVKWVEIGYLIDPKKSMQTIFYVRDNGIGIEKEQQEIIFRIFKRLHTQKAFGGGTGAGLTIVKKIIERHGGKIWVKSTLGEGTTFYFTLAEESK